MTRRRIALDFSDTTYSRLQSLKTRTGASTLTEVVKRAIQLLEVVVDSNERGGVLRVVEGSKERDIQIIL